MEIDPFNIFMIIFGLLILILIILLIGSVHNTIECASLCKTKGFDIGKITNSLDENSLCYCGNYPSPNNQDSFLLGGKK
jgi:hypothetical protein